MHTAPTHVYRAGGAAHSRRWLVALLGSHYVWIDGALHGQSFHNCARRLVAVNVQTAALYVVTRGFLGGPEEGAVSIFTIGSQQ